MNGQPFTYLTIKFLKIILKKFRDDRSNILHNIVFSSKYIFNIVRKREKADYQHFLHLPQLFPKASSPEILKVGIVWWRGLTLYQMIKF